MTSFTVDWERPTAEYELEELRKALELPEPSYVDKERLGF